MPKVNIIIPVYNQEKYIGKCLETVINQTEKDIEAIVVDDKSKDKSLEIIKKYEEQYPNIIKVLENPINKGVAYTRNKALEIADGEYIGFVDSDDYIEYDMYEKLYNISKEYNLDIARANRRLAKGPLKLNFLIRNTDINTRKIIYPKQELEYLTFETPCVTNKLFKRELIGGRIFPENLKWEDYPFCIPLLYRADKVGTYPEYLYNYRLNLFGTTVSDSKKINPNILDIFTCSEQIIKELSKYNSKNLNSRLNFLAIQNALQRLRDILLSNISNKEKRELISLFSRLIELKYGTYRGNEMYEEYRKLSKIHNAIMNIIENFYLESSNENDITIIENRIKQMVKK